MDATKASRKSARSGGEMIEFHSEIRFIHMASAIASGALFLLRGLTLFFGAAAIAGIARAAPVRYLTYTNDTILLTAALMLTTIVKQYPFVDAWLTVKVLSLIVYIALGVLAFRRGGAKQARILYWLLALAVFAFIYSVARTHNPIGFLSAL